MMRSVVKASADKKTATVTVTLVSLGMLPALLGDVSLAFYDSFVTNITRYESGLNCSLPAAVGAWTTVTTKPEPLAPRKTLKVTFKGVALPTTPQTKYWPFMGFLVVDSACKSSPPIFTFGPLLFPIDV
jgi:hypothetical protein